MGFIYPTMDQLLNHTLPGCATAPANADCQWCCALPTVAVFGRRNITLVPRPYLPIFRTAVVIPSSPARAYGLLLAAIRDPDPVVSSNQAHLPSGQTGVPDDSQALPWTSAMYCAKGATSLWLAGGHASLKHCRLPGGWQMRASAPRS